MGKPGSLIVFGSIYETVCVCGLHTFGPYVWTEYRCGLSQVTKSFLGSWPSWNATLFLALHRSAPAAAARSRFYSLTASAAPPDPRPQPHHRRSAVLGTRVRRGEAVSPGCVLSCPSLLLSVRKRCCSLQRAGTCMLTAPLFPSIQFRRSCLIPSGTGVHWCLSISQACFFRGKREA